MPYYDRAFLNEERGTACYEATVRGSQGWEPGRFSIDAYFDLTDCSRKVSLDFCCYPGCSGDEEGFTRRKQKLDKLIDALVSFSAAIDAEHDRLLQEAKEEAEADQQL